MKELSLHILDLVQNSLRAQARCIRVSVKDSASQDRMEITIEDDVKLDNFIGVNARVRIPLR